jgi:hypothetical protein
VKYAPSILLLITLVLFIFGFINQTFFLTWIGILNLNSGSVVSWVYMRFYKYHDGVRGDRSETFSFTSFFPDQWQGVLKPISKQFYNTLVSAGLLPALPPRLTTRDLEDQGPSVQTGTGNNVGGMSGASLVSESDRRKALALQALEDRIKKKHDR